MMNHSDEQAVICNIQRFSVHDGPGARTVVFLKGCSLRCAWCHNPESINPQPELLYYHERCIHCGRCRDICPTGAHRMDGGLHHFQRDECVHCMKCAAACYAEALAESGIRMTSGELMKQILDEKPYYGHKGGVTFSGGEALLHVDFVEALLKLCGGEGIHCAIDTAGHVTWSALERVIPYNPLFLYDIKAADPSLHKTLTGVTNERILENLRRLVSHNARLWIRVPYIPGYNSDEMPDIADICASIQPERVDIIGYHRLGESKYAALGIASTINPPLPTADEMGYVRDMFHQRGISVFI